MNTIENQREALESASANTAVLSAMGDAAKAMKKAHQLDVDDVRNSDELYQIMHKYISRFMTWWMISVSNRNSQMRSLKQFPAQQHLDRLAFS